MNAILKKTILNRSIFIIAYMVMFLFAFLPISMDISLRIISILPLWGLLIIAYDIFVTKTLFTKKYISFLFLFLLSYSITLLINIKFNIIGNIKTLIWTAIYFLVIFTYDRTKKNLDELKKNLFVFNNVVITFTLITTIISLLTFIFNKYFYINGYIQGFTDNRLYGIYFDVNHFTFTTLISLILSYINILILDKKHKYYKVFKKVYIVNMILQFLYLVLSNSRGALISFIISSALFVFIKLKGVMGNNTIRVYLKALIIAIVVAIIIPITVSATKNILSYIPVVITNIIASKDINIENEQVKIEEEQIKEGALVEPTLEESLKDIVPQKSDDSSDDVKPVEEKEPINEIEPLEEEKQLEGVNLNRDNNEESNNARISIWTEALNLYKDHAIFGTGDRNFSVYANNNPEKYPKLASGAALHNGLLTVLLASGVIGFIILIIFIVSIFIKTLLYLLNCDIKLEKNKILIAIFTLCSLLGLASITLSDIFLANTQNTIVFWLYLGVMVRLSDENNGEVPNIVKTIFSKFKKRGMMTDND